MLSAIQQHGIEMKESIMKRCTRITHSSAHKVYISTLSLSLSPCEPESFLNCKSQPIKREESRSKRMPHEVHDRLSHLSFSLISYFSCLRTHSQRCYDENAFFVEHTILRHISTLRFGREKLASFHITYRNDQRENTTHTFRANHTAFRHIKAVSIYRSL